MEQRFELRRTGDGSSTVFDREAGECFRSRHAARLEAEQVFYRPGVLESARLGVASPFRVLELGFGLGTNWRHLMSRGFRGEFVSIDRDLAGVSFLLRHEPDPGLARLVEMRALLEAGCRSRLLVGEFQARLAQLAEQGERFDAVFFDPFSPTANPEAWTQGLFAAAAALLEPEGRLVTYSVSRVAKDAAGACGLRCTKRELPPELQKRSSLVAILPGRG